MTPAPDVAAPDVDARTAAEWMVETGDRHLPVVGDDLAGIVSIRDLMGAVLHEDGDGRDST